MRNWQWLGIVFLIAGCGSSAGKPLILKAKTPVHAILLTELTSGGSQKGDPVMMMTTDEIKDGSGNVLVPKGASMIGDVTWSRAEGTLGSLTNEPARLNFKFKSLILPDGSTADVSASPDQADADYELNRENTGFVSTSRQIDALAEGSDNAAAMAVLQNLVQSGKLNEQDKAKIADLAQQLDLPATTKAVTNEDIDKVASLIQKVRQGATVGSLASGGSMVVVDAAIELIDAAGELGDRLSRTLGGRNIHAYVGTPVTAYVEEDTEVFK